MRNRKHVIIPILPKRKIYNQNEQIFKPTNKAK